MKKGTKEKEELQMKMIKVELEKEVIQKEQLETTAEEEAGQNHQEIDHLKTEREHEVDLLLEESKLFQKVQGGT